MKFYSTNNRSHFVSLQEAVLTGLAPDNGLYMPEHIPVLSASELNTWNEQSFQEIAFTVAHQLLGDDLPSDVLKHMIQHTVSFDAPLKQVEDNVFALELFHGPTLAFKDFGARLMSQVLGYLAKQQHQDVTILVATSGDTGSAVANGFLNVPGTRVIVLYPSGKVSEIQEKQFTTLGGNCTALEVNGTFDDCQRLVKQSFLDDELRQQYFITSANSINIARLIPQTFYYCYAWSRLAVKKKVVFSVPSGNFGNLTAGLIAKRMGVPIHHFVAATNVNDSVPQYLNTGKFQSHTSIPTISNAMDVGNPSNLARMLDLYDHDVNKISKDITGYSFTDEETKAAMKNVFHQTGYCLDPHGAIGYLGLKKFQQQHSDFTGVFLETAHPAKFLNVVEDAIGQSISIPASLQKFLAGEKKSIPISSDFQELKFLLKRIL